MRIIDFDCKAFVKDTLECVLFDHGVDPGLEGILVQESLQVLTELLNDHFQRALVLRVNLKVNDQAAQSGKGLGDILQEI